jgi:hypothetical protein
MIARLWLMLGRRLGLARRLTVAALGVLALGAVASALTPARWPTRSARPPAARSPRFVQAPTGPAHPARLSAGALGGARRAAVRFLAGYLPFLYGRGSARSIDAVASALRRQLMGEGARVTPAECLRRPRVISLTVVGQAPRVVVVGALVEDGGVAGYALRITLREGPVGWVASAVDGG